MEVGEIMDLKNLEIDKDHLKKVIKNIEFNEHIGKHYFRLFSETKEEGIQNKLERLNHCNNFWILDKYEIAKVKDFKKTNLCKDKFCNNCKKVKQATRMAKFIPLLRPYSKDMFQLTLTVPNVKGESLDETIKRLFKSFTRLTEYLKGKKKIKGVDFSKFNYEGAIRSFEVTYKKWDEYHPHLHCLMVFPKYIGIKKHRNSFSIDHTGKREERLFTDEEILIQRIWYLLNNKIKVTKENIDNIAKIAPEKYKDGYSCQLDKFQENDFVELFKYMTKSTTEDDKPMRYGHFKTLYYALHGKRQIQGYGCFYNVKDDDEIDPEVVEEAYNQILKELQEKEKPREVCETPQGLNEDTEYLLISRKKIHKHLKEIIKKDN